MAPVSKKAFAPHAKPPKPRTDFCNSFNKYPSYVDRTPRKSRFHGGDNFAGVFHVVLVSVLSCFLRDGLHRSARNAHFSTWNWRCIMQHVSGGRGCIRGSGGSWCILGVAQASVDCGCRVSNATSAAYGPCGAFVCTRGAAAPLAATYEAASATTLAAAALA